MSVFVLVFGVWVVIFFLTALLSASAARRRNYSRSVTVAHDGHRIPQENDVTCEGQYGHDHSSGALPEKRYIVHEEPEEGYVILNGVKRRIRDCKYL